MKKLIIIALALVLCLGLAGMASASVVNSLHDLGNGANNPVWGSKNLLGINSGQVCVFCHHPHRGTSTAPDALLWNMNDWGAVANFSGYTSVTMNATTAAVNATAPQSFLCMACHDGTIGVAGLVQRPKDATAAGADASITGAANLGTTLTDDHPVNFTYTDASSVDTGIKAPVANTVTGAKSGTNTYPLFGGTMQCATCHDVHAGTTTKDTGGIQFMRGDTAASEICVDCHINK